MTSVTEIPVCISITQSEMHTLFSAINRGQEAPINASVALCNSTCIAHVTGLQLCDQRTIQVSRNDVRWFVNNLVVVCKELKEKDIITGTCDLASDPTKCTYHISTRLPPIAMVVPSDTSMQFQTECDDNGYGNGNGNGNGDCLVDEDENENENNKIRCYELCITNSKFIDVVCLALSETPGHPHAIVAEPDVISDGYFRCTVTTNAVCQEAFWHCIPDAKITKQTIINPNSSNAVDCYVAECVSIVAPYNEENVKIIAEHCIIAKQSCKIEIDGKSATIKFETCVSLI